MINDKTDKDIEELFESLRNIYQIGLETSMRGMFDYVHLMYYKFHEINFKGGDSYVDSPDWILKKVTINPFNKKDNKCLGKL